MDPTGPARTLSANRTDPTEFRRKKSPCGSGRVRVVEFSYNVAAASPRDECKTVRSLPDNSFSQNVLLRHGIVSLEIVLIFCFLHNFKSST